MPAMKFIGVDARAKLATPEMNRLYWEIDYALNQGENLATLRGAAEALAIAVQIGKMLDARLPPGAARSRFEQDFEFFKGYYEVPR